MNETIIKRNNEKAEMLTSIPVDMVKKHLNEELSVDEAYELLDEIFGYFGIDKEDFEDDEVEEENDEPSYSEFVNGEYMRAKGF